MAAFTPGLVQLVATLLLALGFALVAVAVRQGRPWVGAGGAALVTVGLLALYASFARFIDAPTRWSSVRRLFSGTFDSWPYAILAGIVVGGVLVGGAAVVRRGWPSRIVAGALVLGGVVGAALVWLIGGP